jgi:dihydrofolate synthase/folylpolyglutamate synthase
MSHLDNYLHNLQRFGINPGLERIRALLQSANDPQSAYPILLVGGTNGKGSTCEFAARLLAQEGRRIGLYTSPHLYRWNERIRILPGEGLFEGEINDADLDALFFDALPHIEKVAAQMGQLTEFEVVTFLGLWHFARQKVDAAVVEVGLGGKWDATNVTEPLVSVVTHVALDHMDRLGNTVEEIAADKVEIARGGRPFLTAETRQSVLDIFQKHCAKIGAEFHRVDTGVHSVGERADFQSKNLELATAAALELQKQLGWQETAGAVHLEGTQVVGRAEKLGNLILDGANNPDGAEILAKHITKTLAIPPSKLILVLGILADKDFEKMTRILVPLASKVIVTQSTSPRAATTTQVAPIARETCSHVEEVAAVAAAVERAQVLAGPSDTILVTGSFTTIAEVPRPEREVEREIS